MAEVQLDDRTARANLTIYSDIFQQYRMLLIKDQLIIVRGEVVADDYIDSGYSIVAREIYNLDQIRAQYAQLKLKITTNHPEHDLIESLQNILLPFRNGQSKVWIEYENGNAYCKLNLGDAWRIKITDNLLDALRNSLGQENVMVQYNN
jgi:DNA polymerase-3 subunit alpha